MRTINLILDREQQNKPITVSGILQGNENFEMKIKLADSGKIFNLTDDVKPTIIYRYMRTNKAIKLTDSTTDYPVSVLSGEITINPNRYAIHEYGQVQIKIVVDELYTYSALYNVDQNLDYSQPPLDVVDSEGFALKDLSNITDITLGNKINSLPGSQAMQKTVTDLETEVSNKANEDLSNVQTKYMDSAIRLTQAYKTIANKHPAPPQSIESGIFYLELQKDEWENLDWRKYPQKFIHAVFQFTADNETINFTLPLASSKRTFIIENVIVNKNCTLNITPGGSDLFNGSSSTTSLTENGIQGVAIYETSLDSYDWTPYPIMHDYGISVSDADNNLFIGKQEIDFVGATCSDNAITGGVTVTIPNSGGMTFVDSAKQEFKADKMQSLDKSLRISNLGNVADLSVIAHQGNEGILAFVGFDELYNTEYNKSKIYFGDYRVKGGTFVYADENTKSFVLQDIDPQDDPNISGGTTFLVGLNYVPSPFEVDLLTQTGYIRIELVDDKENVILDIDGNPMAVQIDYAAGDKQRGELYLGECRIKSYTEVHLKIDTNFPNEEILSVGSNTCVMFQSITKDISSGLALLSFMAFTGYKIGFDKRYYGLNSMNLARFLIFPTGDLQDIPSDTNMFYGDNTFVHFSENGKANIKDYHLNIKDNGTDLPVFNIFKWYKETDTFYIKDKNHTLHSTVTITNKDGACTLDLLKYTGTASTTPTPILISINGSGTPTYANGWSVDQSLFISEDATNEDTVHTITFTTPADAKELAVSLRPSQSELPTNISIKDCEVDIQPWFNKLFITSSFHESENYIILKPNVYRSLVITPSGYSGYRYTVNKSETKIPFGVISGGDSKIVNDNSWSDAGSSDPNKVQGDAKVLADGEITLNFAFQVGNDISTDDTATFYLVNKDGTEIPNTRFSKTVVGNQVPNQIIRNPQPFTISVKANDVIGIRSISNFNDGFYLQSGTNGKPMIRVDINFKEYSELEQRIKNLENNVQLLKNDNGKLEVR